MPLIRKEAEMSLRNVLLICGVIVIIMLGIAGFVLTKDIDGNLISPRIAVIPLKGEITSDMATDFIKTFDKADEDITISAIIIDINSPGGAVAPSRELAVAVKNAKKPVVALIGETGASGGYWVASSADKIVADPISITGSIGVIGSYLQYSGLMEKYGVTYERLVSGKFKDAGSQYKDLTDDERAYLQGKIDIIQNLFVSDIAVNRNMPTESVSKLATGEIFFGTEAKNLGLIDILGGKPEAQKTAEELAGITSSHLVDMAPGKGVFSLLGVNMEQIAYFVGKGIGDSFNPTADANSEFTLVAEMQ